MKSFIYLTMTLLACCLVFSCGSFEEKVNKIMTDDANNSMQTVTVKDTYKITLPKYMTESSIIENADASLRYGNLIKQVFIIVIEEDKEEFINYCKENGLWDESKTVLELFSDICNESNAHNFAGIGAPLLNNINNDTTNVYTNTLNSVVEGIDIHYRIGYKEGKKYLYQVIGWTPLENKEKYDNTLKYSLLSLKEL